MTVAQRLAWERDGRPVTLARPLVRVRDVLRAAGYTVYDIGNLDHLNASPAEDHTPYSQTGYPLPSPYGWLFALDIMPPRPGSGLPSLQRLGQRLYLDRMEGRAPWLKYMNWGPDDDRHAVQDRWMPSHQRRSSTDTGHIHLSAYSTCGLWTSADTYNPLGALMDVNTPISDPLWDTTAPDDWAAQANGGPVLLGQLLGGLHRRTYLALQGVRAMDGKLNRMLEQQQQILDAIAAGQAGTVPQEAVDAALLTAMEALRFETRAVVPDA